MKNLILISLIIFILKGLSIGAPQGSQLELVKDVLTLEDCLDRAFVNNPQLLAAEQEVAIAKTNLSQAKSLFYPHVGLDLNYVRYRNETLGITDPELGFTILEAPLLDPNGQRGNPFTDNLYVGRLGFKQTLFAGGRLRSTYRLSQANLEKAESAHDSLKLEIEFETRKGFYSLLAIRQKLELLGVGLQEMDELSRPDSDSHGTLAVNQAKSILRQKLAALRKEEQQVEFDFLQVMGLELFSKLEIEGSLDKSVSELDLPKVLAWAKQNRPELKQTQLEEEADQLSVNLALAERYPIFRLGGAYELRDRSFPLDESNWNTSLTMNIPLFNGFSSLARIQASQHKAQQGKFKRVNLEDEIDREVRSAYENLEFWKQELQIRRQELGFLQKSRNQYASARNNRSVVQRLDFVNWHLNSRERVIEARYQLTLAQAQIEKVAGRPLGP